MKVFPAKFWVLKEKSFALIFVCRKATVTKRERERERWGSVFKFKNAGEKAG